MTPEEASGLTIGEVARRVGLDPDTIRYYERTGVLPRPRRDGAGRRVYGPDAVHLIEVLLHLRGTGMPLGRIAAFTRQVGRDPDGVPERLAMLREHRREVLAQIESWQASMSVVEQKIRDYEIRLDEG